MAVDIVVGLFLLVAIVRGWMKGFLVQLGQIVLVALAFGAGRLFGHLLEPALSDAFDASHPQVTETVAFFAVFVLVYIVGAVLLHWLTRDLHREGGVFSTADKSLGLVFGLAKGALLVYVFIIGLIMLNQLTGMAPVPYANSATGRLVMQNNFLESEEFPRGRALLKLGWLLHSTPPDQLAGDPHFVAIVTHPKAAPLRTPEVANALYRGDWLSIVQKDAVWDLLDEPEIQEHLNAIEWRTGDPMGGVGAMPSPPAEKPPEGEGFTVPKNLRPGERPRN